MNPVASRLAGDPFQRRFQTVSSTSTAALSTSTSTMNSSEACGNGAILLLWQPWSRQEQRPTFTSPQCVATTRSWGHPSIGYSHKSLTRRHLHRRIGRIAQGQMPELKGVSPHRGLQAPDHAAPAIARSTSRVPRYSSVVEKYFQRPVTWVDSLISDLRG